jgi:hypothetical protein
VAQRCAQEPQWRSVPKGPQKAGSTTVSRCAARLDAERAETVRLRISRSEARLP